MDDPDPPRLPPHLPRTLLALSLACTVSLGVALVVALSGHGVPPLWLLALPPVAVGVWSVVRR